jgi:hypothetical protein
MAAPDDQTDASSINAVSIAIEPPFVTFDRSVVRASENFAGIIQTPP